MRSLFTAAAMLALAALPALASPAIQRSSAPEQAIAMCRTSCTAEAMSRLGGATQQALAACTVRCNAAGAFVSQQNRSGTAEATGRGRTAAPMGTQTAPVARPVALNTAAPIAITRQNVGVIYASRAPETGYGIIIGSNDRATAHRLAERQCAAGGQGCRAMAEFTAACGAVAHGVVRSQWALFMTSNPQTYVVTSAAAGSGATQQAAEQDAMAECRSKDPRANCRITAATCGNRG